MPDNENNSQQGNSEDHRQNDKHRPPEHRVKPPRPFGS
jgi:hypothetical protein